MSVHVSSDVWRFSRARGAALLVLLSLADQANDEGQCWPKLDTIATRCRVSRRSVVRYLDELRDLGELSWENRQADRLPNLYVVRVTGGASANLTPAPSATVGLTLVPPVALQEPSVEPSLKDSLPSADASDEEPQREDVERLCTLLADLIEKNGSKRPVITKAWRDSCRLLLDRDGKMERQVEAAIRWCQQDSFWMGNVLSMPTLRKQYDKLRLKAQQEGWRFTPEPERSQGMPAELMGDFDAQERYWAELAELRKQKAAQG